MIRLTESQMGALRCLRQRAGNSWLSWYRIGFRSVTWNSLCKRDLIEGRWSPNERLAREYRITEKGKLALEKQSNAS